MTELETLRDALRAPPDEPLGQVDVERVMATGTRIRRRRRLARTAGAAVAVVVVALAVGGALWIGGPGEPAGPPAPTLPIAAPKTPPPGTAQRPPLGEVVGTGIHDEHGEIVLYVTPIDRIELPKTGFGVVAGHRSPSGRISIGYTNNETEGSAWAPGFHAVSSSTITDGRVSPMFGYYIGPATKITTVVNGREVVAGQARWNVDPRVVLFWFAPEGVAPEASAQPPTAYDAEGNQLPSGDNALGVG